MKSHPASCNCPFTLLFHLPFEPIWLTGQKWGHLCTKPLKPGDYLLARDGGSVPTRSTCCWPWLAWGGPWFTFSLSWQGYARSRGWLPPTRGFPELCFPAFLRDPTAASEWHLALGCRTAAPSLPRSPELLPGTELGWDSSPSPRATPAQTGVLLPCSDDGYDDAMAQLMPVSNSS